MNAQGTVVERHPLIEDVLSARAAALGGDAPAYRGHVYRVYNVARQLLPHAGNQDELALASVFHDLGIWSARTFDYLGPSLASALEYAQAQQAAMRADFIRDLIMNHHVLRRVRVGIHAEAVEAFRRADLVDLSRGLVSFGLDRGFLREARSAFPYAGFHAVLARTAWSWFIKHPLHPFPMLRLSPAPEGRTLL